VAATFKILINRKTDTIPRTSSLREDWRLICLVLIFSFGILLHLNGLSVKISSNALGIIFITLTLACFPLAPAARIWIFPIAAFVLGTASAQHKLEKIHPNTIERESFVQLSGFVNAVEYRPERPTRLTIEVDKINKEKWLRGQKIRISVRTKIPKQLDAGAHVSLNAVLSNPLGAIVPGGFDFGQYNRLKGIAAQGFAASSIRLESGIEHNTIFSDYLENTRSQVSSMILGKIEQPLGGVAVALITGQRQHILPETANIIRDAGLAHLLAISGLHMGLVTGAAFFVLEFMFAGISGLALRVTPRKAAAIFAWLFALIYLGLSGASTSTLRAFVMVSVAIIALLTDRRVFSLRSVAIAAFIILLFSPDALLGSGFQMSFAATIGIVVAYDYLALRRENTPEQQYSYNRKSYSRKASVYFLGAAGTSLIAQLAVGPIALYHFQTFSVVGIISNVVAIPLMAFLVMPAAFLAIFFSTMGLEEPFFAVMEGGLYLILEIATILAKSPMSVISTTPYGGTLLIATGLSLMVLMMWRSALALAVSVSLIAFALILDTKRPADVLLAGSGNIIAERSLDGNPAIIGGRRNGFRDDAWKRYWGHRINSNFQKLERSCDSRACKSLVHIPNGDQNIVQIPIVVSNSLETTREACSLSYIVIASYTHRRYCRGALKFLSKQDIERYGPVGLWVKENNTLGPKIIHQWSNPLNQTKE